MPNLFSPKRDYWTWTRQRLPMVLELVKLGFTQEEIAKATKASISTIQRDLQNLRQRRMIEDEPVKLQIKRQENLIRLQVEDLNRLSQNEVATPQQIRLREILLAWLKTHEAGTQTQTSLPLLKR